MIFLKTRRERESIIVQSMIEMYCKANHRKEGSLCTDCAELSQYANKRLLTCMYGDIKPVCKECPVHCYSPLRREQMRLVMRWAGPRMLYKKPIYAFIHSIDNITAPTPKNINKNKHA